MASAKSSIPIICGSGRRLCRISRLSPTFELGKSFRFERAKTYLLASGETVALIGGCGTLVKEGVECRVVSVQLLQ